MVVESDRDGWPPVTPIAIIGMGMRFPGDSHSSEAFWDMLSKGRTGWAPIPKHRYNSDGYYHPDSARAGSICVKGSHFLSGEYEKSAQVFDGPFFNMAATEVNGSDPQQLHMLEVSYEALENAGIPIHAVAGSDTSVYVGCFTKDYEAKGGRDPYTGPFYAATGNGSSMLSNRVSWFYDMRGPSMTVDTACSSSLYAVHLACQALRAGESKMAIAGGTNLICDPSYMRDLTTMGFLSPDGKCHSFDHRANGYARGDGIAAVVLKTLDQALKDGDTIRGVIRNSGLGQDGRTPGITMPSPEAQADLIRMVYKQAGVSMDQTAYFEAHGTGTPIGDPYELSALGATFGKTRKAENPLYVGSVKTNIGHLEGCAGLAGLIKTILVVERGQIPPLADFEKPNPRLKLEEWKVALPTELTSWPLSGVRRASVNCFGYGGANSHVIIDDAYHYLSQRGLLGRHQTVIPAPERSEVSDVDSTLGSTVITPEEDSYEFPSQRPKLFVLSSMDQAGLQRTALALSKLLFEKATHNEQPGGSTDAIEWTSFEQDLAYTLASKRSFFDHRSYVVAKSHIDLCDQLSGTLPKLRRGAKNNNILFVFTGQGAQWPTMGEALMAFDTYRRSLERAQEQLDLLGCTWSLIHEMNASKGSSRIDRPEFSQPLCTALQLALVDLLAEWNIRPRSVVGHSSGEIAAAYAAGYITHEDAIKVAYLRGLFSADVNTRRPDLRGAMMAVALSEVDVKPYLESLPTESVVIACVNSPNSVTLSGDEDKIDELERTLHNEDIFARKLRVKTAYHSPHMTAIAEDYLVSMGELRPPLEPPTATMFSSLTGASLPIEQLDAAYWVKNMLHTVRFSEALTSLLTQPADPNAKGRRKAAVVYSAVVEIGPAEALKGPIIQVLNAVGEKLAASVPYATILSRGVDAEQSALSAVGKLWAQGITTNLHEVNFNVGSGRHPQTLVCLPPYRWNHNKIYHHESAWGKKNLHRSKPRTDLLGMRLESADSAEPQWHNYVRISEQPWMADHKVQQMVIYPGAAMIVQAIEAARELLDADRKLQALEVRDVAFKRGLLVPTGDAAVETTIHLRPKQASSSCETCFSFRIFSQAGEEPWMEICSGSVSILYQGEDFGEQQISWESNVELYGQIRKRACRNIPAKTLYKLFDEKMNLQYGPLHRNVTECVAGFGEGYGVITIADTKAVMPSQFEYPHLIHPTTLDSVFHMQALGYLHSLSGEESLVPISIDSIYVDATMPTEPGTQLKGYSKGLQANSGDTVGDIVLSDEAFSAPKVVVRGFLSRDLGASMPVSNAADNRPRKCTSIEWISLLRAFRETRTEKAEAPEEDDEKDEPELNTHRRRLDELIVLHDDNASPTMLSAINQIVERLSIDCEKILPMTAAQVQLGEGSNIKDRSILSLIEAEDALVARWSEKEFSWLKDVVSAAESILWVTRGADVANKEDVFFHVTTGLLRAVRVEKPQLRLIQLDLASSSELLSDATIDMIIEAFHASITSDATSLEQEFTEINHELHVPRLVTNDSFHAELNSRSNKAIPIAHELAALTHPVRATIAIDHHSLRFSSDEQVTTPLGDHEVDIAPSVITLDAGILDPQHLLGRDAVGVITAVGSAVQDLAVGDDVVACSAQTLRTSLRLCAELVQRQPQFIPASVAVTMPTAIATAQIALIELGRLQPGESVLICTAPDATGLALIQLARSVNAVVFASFDTAYHRRLLLEHVGLEKEHIVRASRDQNFAHTLRKLNNGKGVDVVVSSLPGDISHQSVSCLAEFGRCVSLGSRQMFSSMEPLAYSITILNLDFEHLRQAAPRRVAKAFAEAWALARKGVFHVMPPRWAFDLSDIDQATATRPNNFGSTVVTLRPTSIVSVLPSPPAALQLDPEATYVLAGGLGGIGRSIAEVMVLAGARKITFISRSGAKSEEAKALLASLGERGCAAKAFACNISSAATVQAFVQGCVDRGENIRGVVQCAMALRDSVFDNMTFEQWTESTQPKIQGSWNLHKCLPKDMDFFIMLSSMAGVIGNPGQANYSAAGTFQDALSVHRRQNGLNSTTIDLGIVSDVGYMAENAEQFERLRYLKPLFISERDLRLLLLAAMSGKTGDGVDVPPQVVTGVGRELMQDGSIGSAMAADLKYIQLRAGAGVDLNDASEDEVMQAALKAAVTLRAACDVVEAMFVSQIAKAGAMEPEDVDLEKPMHAYGVDSLAAVEVRNRIFRKVKADVSVFDILSTMPMHKLAMKVVAKSKLVSSKVQAAAEEDGGEELRAEE